MSTVEALPPADAPEARGRTKSISPRAVPVFGVVSRDEDRQVRPGPAADSGKGDSLQDCWVE